MKGLQEKLVFERKVATSSLGIFQIEVHGLPKTFFITTNNGTHDGELFNGHLMAAVQGYQQGQDLDLTPITTLQAVYWHSHPESDIGTAARTVANFFAMPDNA